MINKKIKNLTKIFLIDYIEKLNVKNEKNKINFKSLTVWMAIILTYCLTYISVNIINNLKKGSVPEIFFKIYLPMIATVMLFQLITIVCNIFYYSKDLEYILPLPVKSIEILIAKLFTAVAIMYMMEAMFLVIPLFMYGILVAGAIRFFIYGIFVLLIFPVLYTIIISILVLILMNILKKIKNKNVIQLTINIILTSCIGIFIIFSLKGNINILYNNSDVETIQQGLQGINKYYIITDSIAELLTEKNILNNIKNIVKIIIINIIFFIIFIIIGNKLYFNKIIISQYQKNNKNKRNFRYRKNKKGKEYLKIEHKKIIKNTTYFSQTIFSYISIIIIALFIVYMLIPMITEQIKNDTVTGSEELKLQVLCMLLGVIQIISTFNNLSITAVSKEGKEAVFMKYIPMSLYKQYLIKTIPQILLNTIMIISVLVIISISNVNIECWYYIIVFITALLLNIINSFIMLLIDIRKPNLNWTNIESITKNNNNKMFQYVYTIFIILILIYFAKIFKNLNFIISTIIINIILIIIFIILNIYIKKNINKIFNKIY